MTYEVRVLAGGYHSLHFRAQHGVASLSAGVFYFLPCFLCVDYSAFLSRACHRAYYYYYYYYYYY